MEGRTNLGSNLQDDEFKSGAQLVNRLDGLCKHVHDLIHFLVHIQASFVCEVIHMRHLGDVGKCLGQFLFEALLAMGEQVDTGDHVEAGVVWPLRLG